MRCGRRLDCGAAVSVARPDGDPASVRHEPSRHPADSFPRSPVGTRRERRRDPRGGTRGRGRGLRLGLVQRSSDGAGVACRGDGTHLVRRGQHARVRRGRDVAHPAAVARAGAAVSPSPAGGEAVRHARSPLGWPRDPRGRQRPSEAGVQDARRRLRAPRPHQRRVHAGDRRRVGAGRRPLRRRHDRVPRRHGVAAGLAAAAAAVLGRRQLARGPASRRPARRGLGPVAARSRRVRRPRGARAPAARGERAVRPLRAGRAARCAAAGERRRHRRRGETLAGRGRHVVPRRDRRRKPRRSSSAAWHGSAPRSRRGSSERDGVGRAARGRARHRVRARPRRRVRRLPARRAGRGCARLAARGWPRARSSQAGRGRAVERRCGAARCGCARGRQRRAGALPPERLGRARPAPRPAARRGAARGRHGRAVAAVVVVGSTGVDGDADDRLHDRHPRRPRHHGGPPRPAPWTAAAGAAGERTPGRAGAQRGLLRDRTGSSRIAAPPGRSARRISDLRALSHGRRLAVRRRAHAGLLGEAHERAGAHRSARASRSSRRTRWRSPGRSVRALVRAELEPLFAARSTAAWVELLRARRRSVRAGADRRGVPARSRGARARSRAPRGRSGARPDVAAAGARAVPARAGGTAAVARSGTSAWRRASRACASST